MPYDPKELEDRIHYFLKEVCPRMSKRILLVDDEADLVEMMKMRLEFYGYEVFTAYDGVDALEKAKRSKPDLMILDVMMPRMDGFRVCQALKEDPHYAHIPIILFTARAQQDEMQIGEECGANAYLTKPCDTSKLLTTIQSLLQ
jgi:DNA-binding response OmpR family regulator